MKTQRERLTKNRERVAEPGTRLLRGYLHKTSNSLCGIKGYASLIARQAPGDGDEASWAAKIIREVERMEAVFRAVGDLTRTTAADPVPRGLDAVLDRAVSDAAQRHRSLDVTVTGAAPLITRLPAADVQLVLGELLANAAEGCNGSDGAGRVTIAVDVEPTGYGVVRVSDDGPGMVPELLARACEPFVTSKNDHPGVGLTRVETLMDMYGLAWHLHSVEGVGTTVTFEVALGAERIPTAAVPIREAD